MRVVFRTVYETYDVGILFDGTGFAEVGQLRALVLVAAVFELSVELRKGDDGYVEFLGELLERTRYGADFLFARAEFKTAGCHELQVVYDNHADAVFAHQTSRLASQLHYRQA